MAAAHEERCGIKAMHFLVVVKSVTSSVVASESGVFVHGQYILLLVYQTQALTSELRTYSSAIQVVRQD